VPAADVTLTYDPQRRVSRTDTESGRARLGWSRSADTLYEILPAVRESFGALGGSLTEVGRRQVEQDGAVQSGGELDGQNVEDKTDRSMKFTLWPEY
jgi:hypothetical protein